MTEIMGLPFMLWSSIALTGSYLLGSVSAAIIVCHLCRLPDPRTTGSQNPGATNVMRLGGKLPAVFTLFGDALKGFLPVWGAQHWVADPKILAAIWLAALLGHLWPIFFRFQGGKGVATFLGGLIAIDVTLAASFVAIWLVVAKLFRLSSLAALIAILALPGIALYFSSPYPILMLPLIVLVILRHKENILRLWRKEELSV